MKSSHYYAHSIASCHCHCNNTVIAWYCSFFYFVYHNSPWFPILVNIQQTCNVRTFPSVPYPINDSKLAPNLVVLRLNNCSFQMHSALFKKQQMAKEHLGITWKDRVMLCLHYVPGSHGNHVALQTTVVKTGWTWDNMGDGMGKRDRPWLPWMPGQIFKLSKNLPPQSRCIWET